MKTKTLFIALALAAAATTAQAQDAPSNTWIEGDYVDRGGDGDAAGHGVRGSFAFGDTGLYGLGGYTRLDVDQGPGKLDGWELGLGYAHALGDRTQLFGEAAYLEDELAGFATTDGSGIVGVEGYRASVGLRSALGERFEGLVKASYVDGDDYLDGDFSGTVGGLLKLTRTWGVSGDVTFGDDAETYRLGLRATF